MCGLLDSVEVGQACGSDTAHLSLLGYDPLLFYRGRGAFEALGSGLPMQTGDIAFKSNFAFMDSDPNAGSAASRASGPRGIVRKRRADRSFQQWGLPLIEALDGLTLPSFPDVSVAVQHATEHRCGVRLRGPGLTDLISGTDPLVDKRALRTCTPTDGSAAAARTSAVVNELSARIHEVLSAHPLNIARARDGLPIANIVLLRGAGARIAVRPFPEAQGLQGRALMVAPTAIIAGLGSSVGFEVERAPGATGDYHTDLLAKARLVVSRLRQQSFAAASPGPGPGQAAADARPFEFAFLHIKAVDDAGHDRDVARKVEFVERSDEMLALVLRLLAEPGAGGPAEAAWSVVVTGDHSTPVRYGDHAVEPVPFVIAAVQHLPQFTTAPVPGSPLHGALATPRSRALRALCTTHNPVRTFDEVACAGGLLGRFPGREVMPLLRNFRAQLLGLEADGASPAPVPAPASGVPAPSTHHSLPAAQAAPAPSPSGPPQLQSHPTQQAQDGRVLPLLPSCRQGLSPWQEETAPQLGAFSPPPGAPFPGDADVVIIGAGFTGLACAWELKRRRPDLRCVLLERGGIGSGATGRNGGHMHPVRPEEERDVLALLSQLADAGVTPEEFDFRQKGGSSLERVVGAVSAASSSAAAAAAAAPPSIYSPSYAASKLRPSAGSLHPMKLLLCIARVLRDQHDMRVWQHTPVTAVERHAPEPAQPLQQWRVVTPRGTLLARAVVHATNAWVSELVPALSGLVVPVRNHVLLTTPVRSHLPAIPPTVPGPTSAAATTAAATATATADPAPLWDGQSLGWHEGFDYLIQRPDGRVVVGGHRYLAPRMDTAQADARAPLLPYVLRSLQGLLPRTFAPLFDARGPNGDVGVSHAWAGILAFTPSCDPLVGGVPAAPGQFVAAGFSGHGMPRCHPAGRKLAQMAVAYLESGAFDPVHIESDPARRGVVPTQPSPSLLRMLDLTPEDLLRLQQQQQQQQQPTPRL